MNTLPFNFAPAAYTADTWGVGLNTNVTSTGGVVAANYIFNNAPQDGTKLLLAHAIPLSEKLEPTGVRFQSSKFHWLGAYDSIVQALTLWHTAPAQTVEELKTKPVIVGAFSKTHLSYQWASLLNDALGANFKIVTGYRGGNAKAWLLTIVRNTAFSWLAANRPAEITVPPADGDDVYERAAEGVASPLESPEALLIRAGENRQLNDLIAALPAEFRECLVLRELEELSYKEIAAVTGVPIGTVMSRLARARRLVQRGWAAEGG